MPWPLANARCTFCDIATTRSPTTTVPVTIERVKARLILTYESSSVAEDVAKHLRGLGVTVVTVGARSITISAIRPTFEDIFACRLDDRGDRPVLLESAQIPEAFKHVISSVYIPTKPEFF